MTQKQVLCRNESLLFQQKYYAEVDYNTRLNKYKNSKLAYNFKLSLYLTLTSMKIEVSFTNDE